MALSPQENQLLTNIHEVLFAIGRKGYTCLRAVHPDMDEQNMRAITREMTQVGKIYEGGKDVTSERFFETLSKDEIGKPLQQTLPFEQVQKTLGILVHDAYDAHLFGLGLLGNSPEDSKAGYEKTKANLRGALDRMRGLSKQYPGLLEVATAIHNLGIFTDRERFTQEMQPQDREAFAEQLIKEARARTKN